MKPETKNPPNPGQTPSAVRKALPLFALLLGLSLVAYAVGFHEVTVFVEEESPPLEAAPVAQPPRDSFLPPLRNSFTPPPPPPADTPPLPSDIGDHFAISPPPDRLKEGTNVPRQAGDAPLLPERRPARRHEVPVPGDHFAAPPPTAQLKEGTNVPQTENDLILEITRGGLIRLDDGRIKRTYSGKPPTLCPT